MRAVRKESDEIRRSLLMAINAAVFDRAAGLGGAACERLGWRVAQNRACQKAEREEPQDLPCFRHASVVSKQKR